MANGTNSLSAGNNGAEATANESVVLGSAATISSNRINSVAIGVRATCATDANGGEGVAIGSDSQAAMWRATAVGYKAVASAISATALGRGARALITHCIAIGRGAIADTAGMIEIGFWGGNNATDVYFDNGQHSKYTEPTDGGTVDRTASSCALIFHGMSGYDATGTPTNNRAGGDIVLAAGQSTGTASGGKVRLQTNAASGSSNNTKNTLVDRVTVYSTGITEFNSDRVRVTTAATPASATASGTQGDICWDTSYVYVCVATNTWKRSALSSW